MQCDLKLEIDDLHKESETSVKEYFTKPKWDRSAAFTRGELIYNGIARLLRLNDSQLTVALAQIKALGEL